MPTAKTAEPLALIAVGTDRPMPIYSTSLDPAPSHPAVECDEWDFDFIGEFSEPPVVRIVIGRRLGVETPGRKRGIATMASAGRPNRMTSPRP